MMNDGDPHQGQSPVQIDPPGCGCTECLTGEYVPLDQATPEQLMALLRGELSSGLSAGELKVTVTLTGYWRDYMHGETDLDLDSPDGRRTAVALAGFLGASQ